LPPSSAAASSSATHHLRREFIRRRELILHAPSPSVELTEKMSSCELFVTVRIGVGEPESDSVFVLPASHLTRPRLAPLVAMAEDGGGGDVIRIRCRLSDFAEAMALTAVEEAEAGRTACGVVVDPSDADAVAKVGALLKWMQEQAPSPSRSSPAAQQHTNAPPSSTRSIKALSFFKKQSGKKHGPEPAEKFVTVHVGEGEPQLDRVFVLPASHLTRPRLAPLVAMAVDGQHGDVIRIQCRLSDFVEAVALTAIEEADEGRTACGRVVATSSVADKYKHHAHPEGQPLSERYLEAQQALLQCMLDPAATDAFIRDAAAEVINSRTPAPLENSKKTSSWGQRISELLRMTKPAPETPPPPPAITFRPTWALNRRMSAPIS
ncbi:hypothetical protein EJB05_12499, partial [Eragrostis curvula]